MQNLCRSFMNMQTHSDLKAVYVCVFHKCHTGRQTRPVSTVGVRAYQSAGIAAEPHFLLSCDQVSQAHKKQTRVFLIMRLLLKINLKWAWRLNFSHVIWQYRQRLTTRPGLKHQWLVTSLGRLNELLLTLYIPNKSHFSPDSFLLEASNNIQSN